MPKKPSSKILIPTLAILSVIFFVFMAELAVVLNFIDFRVLFGTIGDEPWRNPVNRLDPDLLHIHKANSHFQGKQVGGDISFYQKITDPQTYEYDVKIDSRGFRNNQEFNEVDIAIIGDSFMEATLSTYENMLSTRLSKITGKSVINLAQIWYGPQQELHVLKNYALKHKPKVVLWMFFGGNDLSDYKRYENAKADWENLSKSFHGFPQRSFTKNLIKKILGNFRKDSRLQPMYGQCGERKFYFHYREPEFNSETIDTLDKTVSIIEEASELIKEQGGKFLVAYIPTKFQVYEGHCLFPKDLDIANWKNHGLALKLGEKIKSLGNHDIQFIDLTERLRIKAAAGKQVYLRDDTHWTSIGYDESANFIAEILSNDSN